MTRPRIPNGFILWEGPSPIDGAPIVMIVTNVRRPSKNVKTGPMVQTYILRQDQAPLETMRTGADASVCGSCRLRGQVVDGRRVNRACYVELGKSVTAVWHAYRRGTYPRVASDVARGMLAGKRVRLGAYGDPAMVPFDVVAEAVSDAALWTGYTHQWQATDPRWAGLLMASCDSVDDYRRARAIGWRGFVVVAAGQSAPSGTVECANTRERAPLECHACGMCAGTRLGARPGAVSVSIMAHGPGAKYV